MTDCRLLGLAFRAKALVIGDDMVVEAIRTGRAKLVFLANDSAKNTDKKIKDKCSFYNVPINDDFSSQEISLAIGKENRKVVAVTDDGFAKSMMK